VDALISAIQAEEKTGRLSGRLYMDSIAQAIASVLVQVRGNLKRGLRNTTVALRQHSCRESSNWFTDGSIKTFLSRRWLARLV
jgi:hypothetical protein